MKKIIIAIDYNPSAQKVAETGYELAKALQADVTLIHVITEPAYYAMEYSPIMGYHGAYTNGVLDIVEDIKKEAEKFLAAAATHLAATGIKTKVLDGDTIEEIMKYSEEQNADLIVLGSHTHHGLDRLLGPDVATHILKHSNIALLTIPTKDEHKKYD